MVGTASFEQHWSKPFLASLRHNEIDAFTIITVHFSMNFDPAFCPAMGAATAAGKATFVKIHNVFAALGLHPFPQGNKKTHSFYVVYFSVAVGFF